MQDGGSGGAGVKGARDLHYFLTCESTIISIKFQFKKSVLIL